MQQGSAKARGALSRKKRPDAPIGIDKRAGIVYDRRKYTAAQKGGIMLHKNDLDTRHTILVVDDQEINRDVLGVILEDDYDLLYAEDGVQALNVLRENPDAISLVMLDIFMPNLDGFGVLKAMKEDERMRNIPAIVLTSEKSAELEALKLGAADFLTKPFEVHEVILARVRRVIELCDGRKLIMNAERDRLTMLYSHNFFYEYTDRLYASHPERRMDAVVIDVEQFHSLNSLHGRAFGDEVLRRIADEIRAFLGSVEGIAGHFEADRFEIYCAHQHDYMAFLDRMQIGVNSALPNVSVRMRMGVREWSEGIPPVLMFDQARTACNMARGNYQKPLVVYDDAMQKKEMLNQRLLNDMKTAIEEEQFKVFYQPKYDIRGEVPHLSSAEALIRWEHPELGRISPGDFIPLFEEKGLIGLADLFV